MENRVRRVLAWLAVVAIGPLVLLVPSPPSAVSATLPVKKYRAAANELTCARYVILGFRGSGQAMDGFFDMGKTVGPFAQAAFNSLPEDEDKSTYSVPYPAVSPTDPGQYASSLADGERRLKEALSWLLSNCERAHVGLIGYSQGAHVINSVLRSSPSDYSFAKIWAVLLLGDAASAGDSFYDRHSTLTGGPGTHTGYGILERRALAPAYQSIATDFCITGDPICDAPEVKDIAWIIAAALFGIKIHTSYDTCCGSADLNWPARDILGRELALRMQAEQTPPPVQCAQRAPTARVVGTPAAASGSRNSLATTQDPGDTRLLALTRNPGCGGRTLG